MTRWITIAVFLLFAVSASAAIDSRDKRASAVNVGASDILLPDPNSAIDAADRYMVAGEYSGFAGGVMGEPGGSGKAPGMVGIRGVRIGM